MPASKDLLAQVRQALAASKKTVFAAAIAEGETLPDMETLTEAFHEEYGEVFDAINTSAFNAGQGKNIEKLKKAEAKVKELNDKLIEKDAELTDAQTKAPDVEKIKKSFEAQLRTAEDKANERIAELGGEVSTMRQDRDLGAFEKDLIEAGLKPRAAAAYRAIHSKDFEYDDEGKPVVKHPETGVPFIVAKGAPWSPLVKQLREKADPDDVKATVDTRGAGAIRRGYGSGNGATPLQPGVETALAKKIARDGRGLSGL